ncbi:hypothetical protein E8E12_011497 [Didymella heteroderae]|uniref:Uncharacterized protein n=1 Tax=Didymella heteroderae TaxID=1769908 RepID=A0A9P5C568_9PLEO|nr:hypothetical protein E8E12_011497 [Didymella heteroderae]
MHRKAPISLLSLFVLFGPSLASASDATVCNANHIFNAIHSSMRQWGGSLNHNGMSLFLATVPEGTQLYHGTSDPDFIKGLQWLAFEPEHALIFARPRGGRGPGGPPPGEGGPPGGEHPDDKQSGLDGSAHGEGYWRQHEPTPEHDQEPGHEHERPLPPHHYKDHDRPDFRPPLHEHMPCNGTDRRPPPPHHEHGYPSPDHEHGPRKHIEHGPPPPLPPGHIYKPYPPPPHKERPYKGPRPLWGSEHRPPPPRDHHDDLPEHRDHHGLPSQHRDRHEDLTEHRELPQESHGDFHPSLPAHRSHEWPSGSIERRSEPAHRSSKRQTQHPLFSSPLSEEKAGYLHTYRPLHDLHLLYIDGLSAGKTSNGTLDTQDLLLLNLTASDPHDPSSPHGPMGGEMARAQGLCDLAATLWEHRVDGVIRLEGGFEIILCDFEAHLERVDVLTVHTGEDGARGPMGGWEYTKAVASRYHGIGGGRVRVDYDAFVSVFAYADVRGLWEGEVNSDVRMPRLTNVAAADLAQIKDDVTALVLNKDWSKDGHDWQAVADLAVARYSSPLHHITTTRAFRKDKDELARYLRGLLRPFISPGERNATRETERCVAQIVPPLSSLSVPPGLLPLLAHRALHAVGTRICDTLLTSLSIATSSTPHSSFSAVYAEHAVDLVAELVEWLGWTSWKDCGACGDEEVCFIPIWPTGTFEDHARPRCRGAKEVEGPR